MAGMLCYLALDDEGCFHISFRKQENLRAVWSLSSTQVCRGLADITNFFLHPSNKVLEFLPFSYTENLVMMEKNALYAKMIIYR